MSKFIYGLLLSFFASFSHADPQSKSFSHWTISSVDVTAAFTVSNREILPLTDTVHVKALAETWRRRLASNTSLKTSGGCVFFESRILASSAGYSRAQLVWQCPAMTSPGDQALEITLNTLFDAIPSHVHFANFKLPDGRRAQKLFTQSDRQYRLESGEQASSGRLSILQTYIGFGFEHILIGVDHIAFLLALLLLGGSWRHLLLVVTGFTLGHSITLSLSALGLVTPNILFTEALIGLSIALVAIENIAVRSGDQRAISNWTAGSLFLLALLGFFWGGETPILALLGLAVFCGCYLRLSTSAAQARRLRPALTIGFGLVHGFGFASVLLEVGLPSLARLPALIGFNLGVELGQALLVLFLLLAMSTFARFSTRVVARDQGAARDLLSCALAGLGVYWFLQRLYF